MLQQLTADPEFKKSALLKQRDLLNYLLSSPEDPGWDGVIDEVQAMLGQG